MSSLKSERAHWGVDFKTDWTPIDVRTMSGEDVANYVFTRLCQISTEKAQMEAKNYDGTISCEVMVYADPATINCISEKCSKEYKIRTESSDCLIFYI